MDLDIGKIIKEGRQEKRLSQHALAKLLNVDPSTVSRWESNAKIPTGDTLIKMAKLLDIVTDFFPGYAKFPHSSDIPPAIQEELEKLREDNQRLWRDNEKLWQVVRFMERSIQGGNPQSTAIAAANE